MQNRSAASMLLPTLGLAALACDLRASFNSLGRWQNPQAQKVKFITPALTEGIVYLAAAILAVRYRLNATGPLIILLGAVIFRLAVLAISSKLVNLERSKLNYENRKLRLLCLITGDEFRFSSFEFRL